MHLSKVIILSPVLAAALATALVAAPRSGKPDSEPLAYFCYRLY